MFLYSSPSLHLFASQGFLYKMKTVYAHFPINTQITNGGKSIDIRNFLGEKMIRTVNMLPGSTVEQSTVKDELIIKVCTCALADLFRRCLLLFVRLVLRYSSVRAEFTGPVLLQSSDNLSTHLRCVSYLSLFFRVTTLRPCLSPLLSSTVPSRSATRISVSSWTVSTCLSAPPSSHATKRVHASALSIVLTLLCSNCVLVYLGQLDGWGCQ
jgi:hypothetical protein